MTVVKIPQRHVMRRVHQKLRWDESQLRPRVKRLQLEQVILAPGVGMAQQGCESVAVSVRVSNQHVCT